ncbi:Fc receptor-like protein 3 isoform X1 [Acipenser oxyrinchus oxyrinchus]|uniref:Fc receptor-like protein 3 isoform X1 n=1 Tax=Acipenser oxyrinchus oxyrinchus TaxID=40147 RepID=A0AAD8D483_ACIOX|nr:Fc receptor-like protein 3 isoform X1 [Acipenser oxyrinchus oxyrinchus]
MRVQGEILFILAFACKVFETTGNTTMYSEATTLEAVPVSIEDIAVAFGCFLLLVIVLSVSCVVAFKYRTGEYYPNSGFRMEKSAIWDKDMDEQLRDYSMDISDQESVTKM